MTAQEWQAEWQKGMEGDALSSMNETGICACRQVVLIGELAEAQERAASLSEALTMLGSDYPDRQLCWCEMRIGNPMVREHSRACLAARAALSGGGE